MAQADWTELTDGLDVNSIDRGVTTGVAKPNGGGSFVFGFNSLVVGPGAVGFFTNLAGFAPSAALKGGSIRGAVQRGASSGPTKFAPFLAILMQGASINDNAYMLGLQDDDPHRIALVKGKMVNGIPSGVPGTNGVLRRSTATYAAATWLHLRLDAIVNPNGDVLLKAFQNDLNANAVTSPSWVAIPGIEDATLVGSMGAGITFVDDQLGVNSGSQPYTAGRFGYGFQAGDVSRRGFFDQIECLVQT